MSAISNLIRLYVFIICIDDDSENTSEVASYTSDQYNKNGFIEKTLALRASSAEIRLQWITVLDAATKAAKLAE